MQDISDPAQQYICTVGFADKVKSACFKASALDIRIQICGHEHKGDPVSRYFLKGLLKLKSVHTWHPEIGKDHIRFFFGIKPDRIFS